MASFLPASIQVTPLDGNSVPAISVSAGTTSPAMKQADGRMTLPEGQVVAIQQSQQRMVPPRMLVPVGMAFSSIVSALLQSRQPSHHEFERVVGEPFRLLARRVIKAEWPEGTNPFKKGNGGTPSKQKRKKKKRSREISSLFDSIDFFQHIPRPADVDMNYEDLSIKPMGEDLSDEAIRLDKLREIASDVAYFCRSDDEPAF